MVSIMRVIRAQDELIGALCKRDRHKIEETYWHVQ